MQTIRYLCRSKLADAGRSATLTTDRREYAQGEPVRLRVRFADERLAPAEDDGVTVVVELSGPADAAASNCTARRPAGASSRACSTGPRRAAITPGSPCPPLEGQSPAADFTVAPPAGEFAQVRMDAAEMRRAAEQTGGRFYTFDTADRLLRRPAARPPGAHRIAAAAAAVEPWPVLALFLALLIAEWILRKRRGMV